MTDSTHIFNQQAPEDATGEFVTLRLRAISKPGGPKGKPMFASGMVVRADTLSVTVRIEAQTGFPVARTTVTDVTIQRYRIISASKPLPAMWPKPEPAQSMLDVPS